MPRRGMHHHTLWFIYDGDIIILVHNINRDVLRLQRSGLRLRQAHRDHVAGFYLVSRFRGQAIYNNAAAPYRICDLRTGYGQHFRQKLIKPRGALFRRQFNLFHIRYSIIPAAFF